MFDQTAFDARIAARESRPSMIGHPGYVNGPQPTHRWNPTLDNGAGSYVRVSGRGAIAGGYGEIGAPDGRDVASRDGIVMLDQARRNISDDAASKLLNSGPRSVKASIVVARGVVVSGSRPVANPTMDQGLALIYAGERAAREAAKLARV